MYIEYNSNPENKLVGDCVVRAISKVTDQDWERTYMEVCVQGFMMHDMPSSKDKATIQRCIEELKNQ